MFCGFVIGGEGGNCIVGGKCFVYLVIVLLGVVVKMIFYVWIWCVDDFFMGFIDCFIVFIVFGN